MQAFENPPPVLLGCPSKVLLGPVLQSSFSKADMELPSGSKTSHVD